MIYIIGGIEMIRKHIDEYGMEFEGIVADLIDLVTVLEGNIEVLEINNEQLRLYEEYKEIRIWNGIRIQEEKENNKMKNKLKRFGKGAWLSVKDVENLKPIVRGVLIGGLVGGTVELLVSKDTVGTAVNTVKNIRNGLAAGVGVQAVLNGIAAASDPEYLEYLEEK